MIKQAKFAYSPQGKALEKQIKTTKEQGDRQVEVIEKHEKQRAESNSLFKKMIAKRTLQHFWKKRSI